MEKLLNINKGKKKCHTLVNLLTYMGKQEKKNIDLKID